MKRPQGLNILVYAQVRWLAVTRRSCIWNLAGLQKGPFGWPLVHSLLGTATRRDHLVTMRPPPDPSDSSGAAGKGTSAGFVVCKAQYLSHQAHQS